jgi:hypothetical protein
MKVEIDIDDRILQAVESLRADSDKSLSAIISELLGEAVGSRRAQLHWTSRDMKPLVDLADKNLLRDQFNS